MSLSIYLYAVFFMIIVVILFSLIAREKYAAMIKKELEFDIDIDQMRELEDNISDFIKEKELQDQKDIYKIGMAMNAFLGKEVRNLKCHQAKLSEPDQQGKRYVDYRPRMSAQELRFAFAHECGHIVNRDPAPNHRDEGYGKSITEQRADYVGAALLMPYEDVCEKLEKSGYSNCSKKQKIRYINKWCKEYGVSDISMLKRIKEVSLLKCAESVS